MVWEAAWTFSPNGQTLAFSEFTNGESRIKLCDVKSGSKTCILQETLYNMIYSLDFSGNGQVLVSSYTDGTIKVWQQK
ncbi:hypothetical protein FM036_47400 [Nostoc sp. HG1]|nr:hypothetical protein [Nostoc sp. HG1]